MHGNISFHALKRRVPKWFGIACKALLTSHKALSEKNNLDDVVSFEMKWLGHCMTLDQ